MSVIQKYPQNTEGRDFVVGDIHGCFSMLEEELGKIGFNKSRDRLFCVGDLVDRGPESYRVLEFLNQNWFHTVRGDHEDIIPEDIQTMNDKGKDVIADEYKQNGMSWLLDLTETEQREIAEKFNALPIVIEIATVKGKVGMVHSEVPEKIGWADFCKKLKAGDETVRQTALKSRSINQKLLYGDPVDLQTNDIYRIFSGHSLATDGKRAKVVSCRNWYNIDTGASNRYTGKDKMFPEIPPDDFRLSVVNMAAEHEKIMAAFVEKV